MGKSEWLRNFYFAVVCVRRTRSRQVAGKVKFHETDCSFFATREAVEIKISSFIFLRQNQIATLHGAVVRVNEIFVVGFSVGQTKNATELNLAAQPQYVHTGQQIEHTHTKKGPRSRKRDSQTPQKMEDN